MHGVLFDLALSDVRPLDRYEEIDKGLYTKVVQPVVRHQGMPVQALLYIGNDAAGTGPQRGGAEPAYMERLVAAARAAALPPSYVGMLAALAGHKPGTPPGGRRVPLS